MSRRANTAKGDEDNLLDNDIEACKGKKNNIYRIDIN